jgi:hypothetical protein
MSEHKRKPHSGNSKFTKYAAEKRVGDVKDVAEFTSFSEGDDLREGFYKMHKDGEDSLHREKGKSEKHGKWTVDVLDAKGDHKTPSQSQAKYDEHSLNDVFSSFKELKFGKSGGRKKRSKKASLKKSSLKKGSLKKSPSKKRKSSKKKSSKK